MQIVEHAEALRSREIDADFFARLADRRGEEIRIAPVAPAAGKSDLARPGVAGALGAMDEQRLDAIVAVAKRDRHRGGNHAGLERDLDGPIVP
jgi:hypothetical protein